MLFVLSFCLLYLGNRWHGLADLLFAFSPLLQAAEVMVLGRGFFVLFFFFFFSVFIAGFPFRFLSGFAFFFCATFSSFANQFPNLVRSLAPVLAFYALVPSRGPSAFPKAHFSWCCFLVLMPFALFLSFFSYCIPTGEVGGLFG